MDNKLQFLQGSFSAYSGLETKNESTFYFTTDTKQLFIGKKELTNPADLAETLKQVTTNTGEITELKKEISTLVGGEEGQSIHDMIDEAVRTAMEGENTEYVGDKQNLTTEAKDTIVDAINELDSAIDEATTNAAITITESTENPDYAKVYTFKQGESEIETKINIPKDMVVEKAEVVTITDEDIGEAGQYRGKVEEAGTYIVLTIANKEEDQIFINVGKLVDIYKAATNEEKTKEIILTVDNATREISATLKDGGISLPKLDANLQSLIAGAVQANVITDKGTAGIYNDKSGGQLLFLATDGTRANVSVNDGTADNTNVFAQVSVTDKESNLGTRINLNKDKAYYTKNKNNTKVTDDDEIVVKGDLKGYVETSVEGTNGHAIVANDPSGGLLKFEANNGKESGIAVNDGTTTVGANIMAQIYAKETSSNQGARIAVNEEGAYYTVKTDVTFSADDEIVTKKDLVWGTFE